MRTVYSVDWIKCSVKNSNRFTKNDWNLKIPRGYIGWNVKITTTKMSKDWTKMHFKWTNKTTGSRNLARNSLLDLVYVTGHLSSILRALQRQKETLESQSKPTFMPQRLYHSIRIFMCGVCAWSVICQSNWLTTQVEKKCDLFNQNHFQNWCRNPLYCFWFSFTQNPRLATLESIGFYKLSAHTQ